MFYAQKAFSDMNSLIQNDDEPYIKQNKVAFDSTCLHSRKTHLSSVIQSLQHESNTGCIKLFLQSSNKKQKKLVMRYPAVRLSILQTTLERKEIRHICCRLLHISPTSPRLSGSSEKHCRAKKNTQSQLRCDDTQKD